MSTTEKKDQVAADLRAAANVIERNGWTRHVSFGENGSHCAVGAITTACEDDDRRDNAAYRYFFGYVTSKYDVSGVTVFNDHVAQSADEVISALRAAADEAANQ